jgi:hypothetical protein
VLAVETPAAKAPLPEKRVPLLGPLPSDLKPAVSLVKRPTRALVRSITGRSVLSAEDNEELDPGPRGSVERW